jgi:hypothetical protein
VLVNMAAGVPRAAGESMLRCDMVSKIPYPFPDTGQTIESSADPAAPMFGPMRGMRMNPRLCQARSG